jgi:hypothetical protein
MVPLKSRRWTMSKLVRLPAVIPDDEIRVWCEPSAGGRSKLHAHAPGSLLTYALAILGAERFGIREEVDFATRLNLEERYLARRRTPLEELEAAGFDPETLVLSIRRKGSPSPVTVVTDDLRARLEEAQAALAAFSASIEGIDETKGVFVLSERERDALVESAINAAGAVTSALEAATVGEPVDGPDAQVGASPEPEPVSEPAPRMTLGDFDKVAVLRWEDQDGDGSHLHLRDKERLVGEVYETEAGWRWRCMTSDFRSTESTSQEARDAVVISHCQHLANAARELLREQVALAAKGAPTSS